MKVNSTSTFTFLLFSLWSWYDVSASFLRGTSVSTVQHESIVLCRMLMIDTLFDDSDSDPVNFPQREEEIACIPVINGLESDLTIPFNLPDKIRKNHEQDLNEGNLFVRISKSSLDGTDLLLSPDSRVDVAEIEPDSLRRLRKRRVGIGDLSVAIVRISTSDRPNANSVSSLNRLFDTNGTNFVTQFNKCSAGRLNFHKAINRPSVVDVVVDSPISNFESAPGKLIDAAQLQLRKELGLDSVAELADKVLMCLPSGTGESFAVYLPFPLLVDSISSLKHLFNLLDN